LTVSGWRRVAFAMFAVGFGANQFTPMLVVYKHELGLSTAVQDAIFGVYAIGLVPGLLLGGRASDRLGRRPLVLAFAALSPLATVVLMLGRDSAVVLGLGRLIAGACSGVVFSAASAWVQELSPGDAAARRAAVSLSAGFASGPLVAAAVARWAPDPRVTAYLPHVVLGTVALLALARARETVADPARGSLWTWPHAARTRAFGLGVAPMAPWVFGLVSVSCVILPQAIATGRADAVMIAGLANGLTLGSGVAIQPVARRLEERRAMLAALSGLVLGLVGVGVGIAVVANATPAGVLLAAPPLGAAYGMVLVGGLRETERLARADERGATIAVFLALTYLGFAVPYVVSVLEDAVGARQALGLLAGAVLASLAVTKTAPSKSTILP